MSNEIKTSNGRTVGQWSGERAEDLVQELERIRGELQSQNAAERLVAKQMPHREQLPEDLHSFKAYHIWGCDRAGNCVVGTHANRIEPVDKVRTFSLIDHH
ncbi:MAG: hypothetical protein KDJ27_07590 [Gammaproteobacteria bacterium]|nr:hypothetical protein [Gammaproteobacteria bacterium]MCB1923598.1 hypothetical protein [Gammaproteobacteria bacterium]